MIRAAPPSEAPWIAFSPTPPAPITATVAPGRIAAVLSTAPTPVITPQASRHASSGAMSAGSFTHWLRSTTAISAKAAVRRPCTIRPPPCSLRGDGGISQAWSHEVGTPPAQAGQVPQARISVTSTASPGANPVTPGPVAVTCPAASWP